MISTILTIALWMMRLVGLVVGVYTVFVVYYRSDDNTVCRQHAGRISAAVSLWLSAVFINAFLVDGNEILHALSRIMINASPLVFCIVILHIAKNGH